MSFDEDDDLMGGGLDMHLHEVASQQLVKAELHEPIEDHHILDWYTLWDPDRTAKSLVLRNQNIPMKDWPQSLHWNWDVKVSQKKSIAYRTFCLTQNNVNQGMMIVNMADPSKCGRLSSQLGKLMIHIDYLEVAPWNWPGPHFNPPLYRGVGTNLLYAAIMLSKEEGYKGRVCLHALPQACDFYQHAGFVDLGTDPGSSSKLNYFELTPQQAEIFLQQRRQS